MIKKILCIILIILSLISCSCTSIKSSDLMFYVIVREAIHSDMSDSEIVDTVKSEGRLAFDGDDIEGYNWQNHVVKLHDESVPSLGYVTAESGGSTIFKTDDTYAFVLIIKNTLIYVGGFKQGSKNPNIPLQPSIRDIDNNTFSITFDSKYVEYADNRSDSKLYDFLSKQGLLSAAIN